MHICGTQAAFLTRLRLNAETTAAIQLAAERGAGVAVGQARESRGRLGNDVAAGTIRNADEERPTVIGLMEWPGGFLPNERCLNPQSGQCGQTQPGCPYPRFR